MTMTEKKDKPQPPHKGEMLTPEEIEDLRRNAKETSEFAQKSVRTPAL
jgi:hypothetical protein